jgi:phage head maturation protease
MIKTVHSDGAVIKEIGDTGFGGYFSTRELDRDREIIVPTAFQKSIPMYLKNPSVLPCHMKITSQGLPAHIAKCLRIRSDEYGAYGEYEYLETETGKAWKPLIQKQIVTGMSHRSMPSVIPGSSEIKRDKDGGFVKVWNELELIHIAVEPENSNRGALIGAMKKGISDDTLIEALVKSIDDEEPIEKQLRSELNQAMIAFQGMGKEFGEVIAMLKGLASKDDVVKAIDEFKGELLDPEGLYARAMSNRAATETPEINDNGSADGLLGLLDATQKANKR